MVMIMIIFVFCFVCLFVFNKKYKKIRPSSLCLLLAAGEEHPRLIDSHWQAEPQQGNKRQSKQMCAVVYMSWTCVSS